MSDFYATMVIGVQAASKEVETTTTKYNEDTGEPYEVEGIREVYTVPGYEGEIASDQLISIIGAYTDERHFLGVRVVATSEIYHCKKEEVDLAYKKAEARLRMYGIAAKPEAFICLQWAG